ncbi:MAG TPA: chloroperoxidase [Bacillota bacterium]|nr:chloroperoxidase [Bacillota bacterium]
MKATSLRVASVAILSLGLASVGQAQGFRGGHTEALGPLYKAAPDTPNPDRRHNLPPSADTLTRVRYWNQTAIDASGLDHTPVGPGENRVFGEQLGPCRAARAMAIIHIAMFEAVNAVAGGYQSYVGLKPAQANTSMDAAIAQAVHDTLAALFPSQSASFDQRLTDDLSRLQEGDAKTKGIDLGKQAAAAILALRSGDGSQIPEPRVGIEFITSTLPGKWRQDPISLNPLALGAYWGQVKPFVLNSADQFRIPPPPALNSAEYAAAYNEVKQVGGDGVTTPTTRTDDQTHLAIYWAYDGTPSLCAPPRLYNQIAVHIADQLGSNAIELARLLALANTAMADGAIAAWESKYYYQFWRPVTGIRESDVDTGPTGLGDGNAATTGDPTFTPLGAPASNLTGPDFTPPFPACPSGHATIGASLFQTLRRFYRTDKIAFTFVSDEFNGVTRDNNGEVRPLLPRSFSSLSQAEEENGQSRIYLGIHWAFDKSYGIKQGRKVADQVFENAFEPRHKPNDKDRPPRR